MTTDLDIFTPDRFAQLQKVAEVFARSDFVPEAYRGKPANVIVAMHMAHSLGLSPLMVMSKLYVLYGKPGIEAQLAIALANRSGKFKGPIRFKLSGSGMGRACTAYAETAAGEKVEQTVTMEDAKREGWLDKNGSKWKTVPDLMLQYRSAKWLINLTCPEVLMGLDISEQPEIEILHEDPEPVLVEQPKAINSVDTKTGEIIPASNDHAAAKATVDADIGSAIPTSEGPSSAAPNPAEWTAAQKRIIAVKLANASLNEVDLEAKFPSGAHFNDVMKWLAERQQ